MKTLATLLGTVLLLCTSGLHADSIGELLSNSPFIPEGWTPGSRPGQPGVVAGSGQYIFRGMYQVDDSFYVNINDGGKGRWIRVGETKDGIQVVSCDASARKVVIVANGREQTLEIPKPAANSNPVALAVNSNPRARPPMPPGMIDRVPTSRRSLRPMPPPPSWITNRNPRVAGNRNYFAGRNAAGGNTGGDNGSSGDNGGGFDNGGNDNGGGNYNGSTPSDPTQPIPDDGDSNLAPPPPPPNFTPQIPDALKKMIEDGQSPDNSH